MCVHLFSGAAGSRRACRKACAQSSRQRKQSHKCSADSVAHGAAWHNMVQVNISSQLCLSFVCIAPLKACPQATTKNASVRCCVYVSGSTVVMAAAWVHERRFPDGPNRP